MKTVQIGTLLLATVLMPATLAAQRPDGSADTPFAFRPGQAVYVTAFHTIEHYASRGFQTRPPSNVVDNHLPAELRVRKDFTKRNVYKLVGRAREADFVFLMIIHDNAAEGLALSPAVFVQHQNQNSLNIEALREAAHARATVGPLKIHNLGRLSDKLVEAFHEIGGRAKAGS